MTRRTWRRRALILAAVTAGWGVAAVGALWYVDRRILVAAEFGEARP